jgi:hypothetical protein
MAEAQRPAASPDAQQPTKKLCSDVDRCDADAGLRCARCRSVFYCSAACQARHWPVHRPYCQATEPPERYANGVTRMVSLPDECYESAERAASAGERFEIRGRDDVPTRVVRRRDGRLYEAPSGLLVRRLSEVSSGEANAAGQRHLTTWGRLMTRCGGAIADDRGYAAFYDRKKRRGYVLHKAKDTIVHEERDIDEPRSIDVRLGSSGEFSWRFVPRR